MTDVLAQLDAIRDTKSAARGYSAKPAVDQFVHKNAAEVKAALDAQADEAEADLYRALADFEASVSRWEAVAHRYRAACDALGWHANSVPTCSGSDALSMIRYQFSQNPTRPAPTMPHKLPELPTHVDASGSFSRS